MKEKILKRLAVAVDYVLLGLAGFACVIGWNLYTFQREYTNNVLKSQQETIRAYCEQVWEKEHAADTKGKEDQKADAEDVRQEER